ncbi:uncharacterized protein PV09_06130 [Verruconis gallopava]|uniref:Zn(2)-C6 fungal-type domain-containing protein n=1 Tax=Verruconis gallopava TaxID=253628 RepID=A0A0D2A7G5_9PEZI|nr:uncharacterized protein PV09_06130 [Verruconis gallopava]KIW02693.1 hypothetical protein PV09_06130 [Verruconis gallopava]
MSLRRKSCETCFRAKRKCDLEFPRCRRCQRTGKDCHYVRKPAAATDFDSDDKNTENANYSRGGVCTPYLPSFLGPLGEIRPIIGQSRSWSWTVQQFKNLPAQFANNLENIFIRKDLRTMSYAALRTAFALCAAHTATVDSKESTSVRRVIDVEVAHLLASSSNDTLLQDLANLQALVLYQILRLLHGNIDERITAERQEEVMQTLCTRLLTRAESEIGPLQATWEAWVVAENIRRTVMLSYCVYCVYWLDQIGCCPFFPTLKELPVSTRPELWQSEGSSFLPQQDIPLTYEDFSMVWAAAPRRKLSPFEKMILVPCKGLDQVEMYSSEA